MDETQRLSESIGGRPRLAVSFAGEFGASRNSPMAANRAKTNSPEPMPRQPQPGELSALVTNEDFEEDTQIAGEENRKSQVTGIGPDASFDRAKQRQHDSGGGGDLNTKTSPKSISHRVLILQ